MTLNNEGRKLVHDGSDRTRLRINLMIMAIGFCLILAGVAGLSLKGVLDRGREQELFFLVPIFSLLTCCGILCFIIAGIRSTVFLFRAQDKCIRRRYLSESLTCVGMVIAYAAALSFLIAANSGKALMPLFWVYASAAMVLLLIALVCRISAGHCR